MRTVVVRVWMPDRPGALGQVASRIGAVRGDVLGIEILEHGGGSVIDELTVQLPDRSLIPLLTAEIDAVDGVSVENIREVEPDRADPDLAALTVGATIAECHDGTRVETLARGVERIVEADWVAILRDDRVAHGRGNLPDTDWLRAFLAGSGHLGGADDGGPSDLVWAHMPTSGATLVAGRTDRPIHERERVRIDLLARLADALL